MDTGQISRQRMRLGAGESQWLRAEAGMMFVGVDGGFAVVDSPRWVGDTAWRTRVSVDVGQVHTVDSAGWVQVSTTHGAELLCVPAAPAPAPLARWIESWRLLARRAVA